MLFEYSVLLTPKVPAPLQPVPSTSTPACALPLLSVSVIRLFVGTLAEAAIDPKFIEVGDKLIEQNPCTFAVSELVAGPEPKEEDDEDNKQGQEGRQGQRQEEKEVKRG